jgi:hypothetical protein
LRVVIAVIIIVNIEDYICVRPVRMVGTNPGPARRIAGLGAILLVLRESRRAAKQKAEDYKR